MNTGRVDFLFWFFSLSWGPKIRFGPPKPPFPLSYFTPNKGVELKNVWTSDKSWEPGNVFQCYFFYAQNSLFIVENCNAMQCNFSWFPAKNDTTPKILISELCEHGEHLPLLVGYITFHYPSYTTYHASFSLTFNMIVYITMSCWSNILIGCLNCLFTPHHIREDAIKILH